MNQDVIEKLNGILGTENVKVNETMAGHTTFKIGGPADVLVTPMKKEQIRQVVFLCNEEKVPFFVMGRGSNLLVSDLGMDGVVIKLNDNFSKYWIEDDKIYADAGVMLSKLGRAALENSLTGFEFAAGIPGTLGGAVMMNAGAYGGEMKDVIATVELMDKEGNIFEKSGEEMEFGYRHSIIEEKGYIVLSAVIKLERGEKENISAKMDELAKARRDKQPLEFPSAGSTFKRPEGHFAGKLIMDAGLKGYAVGGACVSEKHCGFVINKGGATAGDVMKLVEDVKDKVYKEFQVVLEPEVRMVGRR